ncbi:MAG: hypothetical protein JXR76_20225 [Deltaproteobacteria bacterium]|nr:hypothetical protein [Deltaproteobacteria bacterium]
MESRIDSAYYNEVFFSTLDQCHAQFTRSARFERVPKLKKKIFGEGKQHRKTMPKRPAHWHFQSLGTFRQHFLHTAAEITRPQGELTLTMNAEKAFRRDVFYYMKALGAEAAVNDAACPNTFDPRVSDFIAANSKQAQMFAMLGSIVHGET